MKLAELKLNPNNPRVIKDAKFKKLCQSIQEFPKMMALRPIIIDDQNVVLGGNMRLKAFQELGYTEIDDSWVKKASDFTEEEKKQFIIKDNVPFGEWDWDILANEWDNALLNEWGVINIGSAADIEKVNTTDDWVGMPEFDPTDNNYKIVILFENETDRDKFVEEYKFKFSQKQAKTWSTWWPFREKDDVGSIKYE